MKKEYWLLSTEHLKNRLWFRDEEDFKAGMNYVAILSVIIPDVEILAFILMSNHVHFVLAGSENTAYQFITRFKKLLSQYIANKYSSKGILRYNNVDFKQLRYRNEAIEKAIAYVQMNCVAANICLYPTSYPWGTGNSFFRVNSLTGTRIGDMGTRERIRLFHSKVKLPAEYIVDEKGIICPDSYIKVKVVESIFKTPKRMAFFLNNSSKAKLIKEVPTFNDQLVMEACRYLSISLFRKSDFSELNDVQSVEILKQLRYRFSSDPNQLARITGLTYESVCSKLESLNI